MKDQGCTQKKIARIIGFSESTISRELKRYSLDKEYYSRIAQQIANFRRKGANQLRCKIYNRSLHRYILLCLKKDWSPEQIAGRLKLLRPDDSSKNISYETIYQMIYRLFKAKKLTSISFLRRKKVKYRQSRIRRAKNMLNTNKKSIHSRPEEVKRNPSIGHWEGDTIEGKKKFWIYCNSC